MFKGGYGFFSLLYLTLCKIFTVIFFRGTRIIRLPIYIRNRSGISFGLNFTSGVACRLDAINFENKSKKVLFFGDNVQINDYVHIAAKEYVHIGDNVLIASKVFITDHNHGMYTGLNQSPPALAPSDRCIISRPVVIQSNVWLGEFVSVMPGVVIGEGSIIGANSVVTKSIDPYCIAVGAPAKVIKKYCFTKKIWIGV
jgi:lipopolysaccharide O-acetyltransferase